MGAVILCRLPLPDAAAEERLFVLAGLALPQARAELLFIGSEQGRNATVLALRFIEDAAADAFRLAAAQVEGVHLVTVQLRPRRVGDPSAALFF